MMFKSASAEVSFADHLATSVSVEEDVLLVAVSGLEHFGQPADTAPMARSGDEVLPLARGVDG